MSLDTGYEERKGVVVRSHRKCNTERRRALCTPSLFVPCIMRKEALLIPCSPNLAPGVSITSFPPSLCLFLARPVSRLFALPRFSFRENSSLPIEQKKKIRLACWIDRSSSHDFINNRFSGEESKKERNHPCFCVEPDGNLNNTRIIGNNNDERANYPYLRTFHFEKISTKLSA